VSPLKKEPFNPEDILKQANLHCGEVDIPAPVRPGDVPKPTHEKSEVAKQARANYARMLRSIEKLSGQKHDLAAACNHRSKYDFPNSPTPCDDGRMRGCQTACCKLYFELSEEDLADGFEYEPNMPYAIRHEADGYCYLLDRKTFQCSVWEKRPRTCRLFDCRKKGSFQHIWED